MMLTDATRFANPQAANGQARWKPLRDGLGSTDQSNLPAEKRQGPDGCCYGETEFRLKFGDTVFTWENATPEGVEKPKCGVDLRDLHYETSTRILHNRNNNPQFERPSKPLCCVPGYSGLVPKLAPQNVLGSTYARAARVASAINRRMQEDHDNRYRHAAEFDLGEACKDYLVWDQQNLVYSSAEPVSSKSNSNRSE